MLDASSDVLPRLVAEIRERFLGLDAWVEKQPQDVPYGLSIVPTSFGMSAKSQGTPYFWIDDVEFRERARPLLPKERVHTGVGEGILVVVPLY